MYHHIEGNIYTIPVTLPDTPLKQLNAYVIRGEDRSLLIDTGFNCETSWESLSAGLRELELDMDRMDIFLTHAHADHAGLSTRASAPGTRVYISRRDLEHPRGRGLGNGPLFSKVVCRPGSHGPSGIPAPGGSDSHGDPGGRQLLPSLMCLHHRKRGGTHPLRFLTLSDSVDIIKVSPTPVTEVTE